MALLIPPSHADDDDDNENICNELGGRTCEVHLKKITIPPDFKRERFLASNGTFLMPGHSYCVYKQPPITSDSVNCDPVWGFWIYCPITDRWLCKSKVPGIYNGSNNTFDACTRTGNNGLLLFDGIPISGDEIRERFTPEEFYSPYFQARFKCKCSKENGYISLETVTRTSCIKDPCISTLPPGAMVEGFDEITGHCNCDPHFVNMYNNKNYPCTNCPHNFPKYDPTTGILTIYLKCKNEGEEEISGQFGFFPCKSDEDKIRGCIESYVRVKPLLAEGQKLHDGNVNNKNAGLILDVRNEVFEDRIF